MAGIFVSYRREDCSGYAGRLADDLSGQFPAAQIFRDIDSIEAGTDFRQAIQAALGSSSVCLVLIGSRWISILGANGQPRLYDTWDFVRLEVGSALARGMLVIPVLIGCDMPRPEHLPDDLKALTHRQAHELSDKRWDYDVDCLCQALSRVVPGRQKPRETPATSTPNRGSSALKWVILGLVAGGFGFIALIVGVRLLMHPNSSATDAPPADAASAAPSLSANVAAAQAEQAPPGRVALTPTLIANCIAECNHLVELCEQPCQGGNACWFCSAEGEKCKQLCAHGSCNPACSYNGRCQGLSVGEDPRDCCPPTDLNDENDCRKLLAR